MPSESAPLTGAWSEGGCCSASGPFLSCFRGADGRADAADGRQREREAGISARTRRPPAASADPPPCSQVRKPPAASEPDPGGASRAPSANGEEPGTRARRGPAGLPTPRARFPVLGCFPGLPQPGLPAPATSAAAAAEVPALQLQGSSFPRLRIPTLPGAEGRRAGGGGRRGGRRGRSDQVSILAARHPEILQAPGPPLPGDGGGRPGLQGGEGRLHAARRRTGRWESELRGHRGSRPGPSPAPTQTPPRSPLSPSEIWGVSLLLKENLEPPSSAREPRDGRIRECCCAPPLRWNIGGIFFLSCIIRSLAATFPLPSLPPPLLVPLLPLSLPSPPLRSRARTRLTPEFSLRVPGAGATPARRSRTSRLRKVAKASSNSGASSGRGQLRPCPAPGGPEAMGNPGFGGTGFPSLLPLAFLPESSSALGAVAGVPQTLRPNTLSRFRGRSSPASLRARTHARRGRRRPRGKVGAAAAPPAARRTGARVQPVSRRAGCPRPGKHPHRVSRRRGGRGGTGRKPCARDCAPEQRGWERGEGNRSRRRAPPAAAGLGGSPSPASRGVAEAEEAG